MIIKAVITEKSGLVNFKEKLQSNLANAKR